MAKYERLCTYQVMLETGLVPLFYDSDLEVAKAVAKACAEGGARVLEFTHRGDHAYPVFCELLSYIELNKIPLILGVGSIIDPYIAGLYIASGANFIVGPMFNPEVAKLCNRHKIPYIPGCGSVTEISEAEELGVEIVKVFPGKCVGGTDFISSLSGPMRQTRIMPTGGVDVTQEDLEKWISSGASCLGMGSKLIKKELVEKRDWEEISLLTGKVLELIAGFMKTSKKGKLVDYQSFMRNL